MAYNPILGQDYKVWVDTSIMAFAQSFEYSMDKKEIDTSNIDSDNWDTFLLGSKGWTASMNAIYSRKLDSSRGLDYLLDAWLTSDASMSISFKPTATSQSYVTGGAMLTSLKVNNGGRDNLVSYSATWKGIGPLTKLTT